ncbi:MAG TPA: leucine-rich repeat-containing protein kinase family protein [Methylotenera sp.]|nr:leucine-rich repeat-containing protein kinase family protein [Methylotenera sp.]
MHTLSQLRAGKLAGTKRLDLSCGLTDFPNEIFDLADSLEILNLSGNALSSLPNDLQRLHKLRVIFCSDNLFTELPEMLGQCLHLEMIGFKANQINKVPAASLPKKLRWLILTDNQITELPSELGSCEHLQKLMLSGNQLQSLPTQMAACSRLELLRISANCLTQLPHWLLSLPRLAWLAYAGNPFSDADELAATTELTITQIDWSSLELQQALGEGASGVIYKANHLLNGVSSPVAVKVFKGSVTSDGLPRSEKAASIAVGAHSGLIPVIGEISGHPQNASGLIMTLIAPNFVNLAEPPSLESCTRDHYSAERRFTLAAVLNIARSIALVAEHLHSKGVVHGDLYAHNILWNEQSDCLLGDFGAASFVPLHNVQLAASIQRIEVRAFSYLLEELLDRCDAPPESQDVFDEMRTLQSRCAQLEGKTRPLFCEIQSVLMLLDADMRK